jgi:hypothetical protein
MEVNTDYFVKMLGCDTARISKPMGKLFLIIGTRRNTKADPPEHGKWFKNGEPIDFDYIEEHVIASGGTEAELLESARAYRRRLNGQPPPTSKSQ